MFGTSTLICMFVSCCRRITCSISCPARFSSFIFASPSCVCEIHLIGHKQACSRLLQKLGRRLVFSVGDSVTTCSSFSALENPLQREVLLLLSNACSVAEE